MSFLDVDATKVAQKAAGTEHLSREEEVRTKAVDDAINALDKADNKTKKKDILQRLIEELDKNKRT